MISHRFASARAAAPLSVPLLALLVGCASEAPEPAPVDTRPLPDVGCDYVTALGKSCAIVGCHIGRVLASDLDLTPDQGLRARLLNVQAKHGDIDCDTNPDTFTECVPTTCPSAKLVNTAVPDASWILKKLAGTQGMCGDHMPLPPGDAGTTGWGPTAQSCVETFSLALAAGK